MPRRRTLPYLLVTMLAATAGAVTGACGDDGDDDGAGLSGRAAEGQQLTEDRGCLSCHSTDGSTRSGPTWSGLAGSEVELDDGSTVTADDEYLVRSILDPDAEVVTGFAGGVMASSVPPGSISREDAETIVAYLRSLS